VRDVRGVGLANQIRMWKGLGGGKGGRGGGGEERVKRGWGGKGGVGMVRGEDREEGHAQRIEGGGDPKEKIRSLEKPGQRAAKLSVGKLAYSRGRGSGFLGKKSGGLEGGG